MTYVPTHPPTPALSEESQARVRATIAAMTGYHIGLPSEEALADESKTVHYCMAAAGVMEIRSNRIGRGVCPAKHVGGLDDIRPGFEMSLPRIPFQMLGMTVRFFREVIKRHNRSLEAIVQIYYDPHDPNVSNRYKFHIPEQRVGGASVNHSGNADPDGNLIHVADIHSHGANMSAFWSATDDGDESRAERLYGVIGNLSDTVPSMKFRARIGSAFVDLNMGDMFDVPDGIHVRMPISSVFAGGKAEIKIDPFAGDDYNVPEEWFEHVKVDTPSYHGHRGHQGSGYGYDGHDAYWNRGSQKDRRFRPAWDRDGDTSTETLPVTRDAVYLVSSTGKRYLATSAGIFPIEPATRR